MNLVLPFLWKEWRAQRGTLISYTVMIFTCLCLGLSLAPTHSWFEEGFGATPYRGLCSRASSASWRS
jgi:hypothetical protein